ncbi:MAG: hypothetical protein M1837_004886 [Sclerophora amabilis]|nr:MAG: hypothetical protein M1837_004886 [Sclerophora amabilis]
MSLASRKPITNNGSRVQISWMPHRTSLPKLLDKTNYLAESRQLSLEDNQVCATGAGHGVQYSNNVLHRKRMASEIDDIGDSYPELGIAMVYTPSDLGESLTSPTSKQNRQSVSLKQCGCPQDPGLQVSGRPLGYLDIPVAKWRGPTVHNLFDASNSELREGG